MRTYSLSILKRAVLTSYLGARWYTFRFSRVLSFFAYFLLFVLSFGCDFQCSQLPPKNSPKWPIRRDNAWRVRRKALLTSWMTNSRHWQSFPIFRFATIWFVHIVCAQQPRVVYRREKVKINEKLKNKTRKKKWKIRAESSFEKAIMQFVNLQKKC